MSLAGAALFRLLVVLAFLLGVLSGAYLTAAAREGHAQSAEVAGAIHVAALKHGVSESRLRCLAWQESRYQPGAYNRAGYHGLYQFDAATWRYGAQLAGLSAASPYDPWSAAEVTALLLSRGEGRRWPPLRWCGGYGL